MDCDYSNNLLNGEGPAQFTVLTDVVNLERERDEQDLQLYYTQCGLEDEMRTLIRHLKQGRSIPPSAALVIARNFSALEREQ